MGPVPLLLLLLPLPWAALGNVGGSAGACSCHHRWPLRPPPGVRLRELGGRVSRAELCPNHVRRFLLPKVQQWVCGLQDSPWVVELLRLWESRAEAQRPPEQPPASPTAPAGPPSSPPGGRSPTAGPTAPEGPPGSPMAGHGPTETHGLAASPTADTPAATSPLSKGTSRGARDTPSSLPHALADWRHREAVGQDPQAPPTAGPAPGSPLAVGLAVGLAMLGTGLGLGAVLVCRGAGLPPGKRGRRAPPPCPTRVGPQYGPCEVL